MNLTAEQTAIVASSGNIKINAVAGSGKTTTVIEYARSRPATARILYLAFNRTVKLEAVKRFAARGLHNVRVETAHSLAYQYVVRGSAYKVRATAYKPFELVELLGLKSGGEAHGEYVLASHIAKFLAYFCNSATARVQQLDYRDTVWDPKALAFVNRHYAAIENGCRRMLQRMDSNQIEITHDFYLKKFQLAGPQLPFEYILFDEAQDASGSMLDLFLKQAATKVMVGDTHQQIYGWRHAVNSLDKADFAAFPLTTSFRFADPIAGLANGVLDWKAVLGPHAPAGLSGHGTSTATATKAVIGRSNLGLLVKAIEYITGPAAIQRLYFEGNINSYTYADSGASLYDVLNLYNGRSEGIRDPLIKKMANLAELEEYAKTTEDGSLLMLVTLVEDYGNQVTELIKELKRRHVADGERDRAQVFFSTVHRCKGLEYDEVQLVSDFVTRDLVTKWAEEAERTPPAAGEVAKHNEEINLLYVALTRAKYRLHYPEACRPVNSPASEQVLCYVGRGGTGLVAPPPPVSPAPAPGPMPKREGLPWSEADDLRLTELFCAGEGTGLIADKLQRRFEAVLVRVEELDLEDKYGAW
ncbi:MAG TPA: UvrD-helicase domain-containing protein [Hymenobacter sp.]|jgi:superfamily I DNA/RNA helicase|uniref:UvrD-helicase domain-containing protein n=1 Tax=Hymenobacter sp. TaxID=1898978 RepID=UPI002EDAC7F1